MDTVYATKEEARTELFEYMEKFYNQQWLHSKLGYLRPAAFDQQHQQLVNGAFPLVN